MPPGMRGGPGRAASGHFPETTVPALCRVRRIIMPIRFETLAVHGGQHPDPTTLSRGVPVYRTSSYLFKSAEHAAKLFGLAEQGNVYGRLGNPTQAMLEERMSLLEGGVGALASASGTSAIFSTIVNLAKQGTKSSRRTTCTAERSPCSTTSCPSSGSRHAS